MFKGLRFYAHTSQGYKIDDTSLSDYNKLNKIWFDTIHQEKEIKDENRIFKKNEDPKNELEYFIDRIYNFSIAKGRGDDLNTSSKNQVVNESHGRCMFKGCGEKLNVDLITGTAGTYGVLAHNVAASENSTRGIPFFSEVLSDDPKNILLLCEKHHRLIDKVAGAEYSAQNLSQMKQNYIAQCEELLNALSFTPMSVYLFFWPVNQKVPNSPSRIDIANCLRPLKSIMIKDSDLIHEPSASQIRADSNDFYNKYFLDDFEHQTSQLLRQSKNHDQKVALFGFGPMPCLIALGSRLGNKGKFIPMLMFRDGSCWMWPHPECTETTYEIDDIAHLKNFTEISIRLNLTADPESSKAVAEQLGHPIININAKEGFQGNGTIRNPQSGLRFMQDIHSLFHALRDKGVQRIHVFPCASNAACIWFGQAFDLNHPEMIAYDYYGKTMVPRLLIKNDNTISDISVV